MGCLNDQFTDNKLKSLQVKIKSDKKKKQDITATGNSKQQSQPDLFVILCVVFLKSIIWSACSHLLYKKYNSTILVTCKQFCSFYYKIVPKRYSLWYSYFVNKYR